MKQLFGFRSAGEQFTVKEGRVHIPNTKYQHDLFFIAPFYHREVTSTISKLIVIDIDLEFRIDLLELHSLFSEFRAGECVGIGPDLSPHYRNMAAAYRSTHPGTRVGQPGRFQGFNSGVALYDLQCLRDSAVWAKEVEVGSMTRLTGMFSMLGTVGDQDWLTLLGWARPELFHVLGCEYNKQTHEGGNTLENADIWHLYHDCPDTKILHNNGSW